MRICMGGVGGKNLSWEIYMDKVGLSKILK